MLPLSRSASASKTQVHNPLSILLTGASGSLGSAIALHHARRIGGANIRFQLWGRDSARLNATAKAVTAAGAGAQETLFDLCDPVAAAQKLAEQDETERFDIAYLVAGTGETREEGALVEDPELVARAGLTNFVAPAAMAAAMADRMAERGGGRIVLIGSAAGHHSLPFASAYSGSKAGLARFADALRIAVKPHGVSVTLAAPGFLDTPNPGGRRDDPPFLLPVDEAARRIVRAGEQGKGHYITPWQFRALKALDAALPTRLRDALLSRLES